ncbi:aminotransferase class I/II-fold pyridoxal phosphate-dependent enzyme [Candidatus Pelagibacter sp.]|jgi:CDP-4-dehydro-6-deoxyglucose reductase, E1|nr:aminotransferase class I/II-fold pyridoxal phosphate-dependent enzyme [Candidatus Pelagibacter sp.]|tara:strand:- start:49 stop:1242 length:1194 start_codon:yes stop_codon:yes gene_type:complete
MKISYGKNVYGKDEIASVVNQLKKTTQMGKSVNTFEKEIAKKFSKKFGLMVNSGSSALTLAMNALNFKKGDEIIAPCLNFGTAISSIIQCGAVPILVDVEIETLQINVEKIYEKITNKTKAILVPNLIGNVPDLKKIREIANKRKLIVIEDSADTLGAKIGNKSTGFFSDVSITSFYGSHVISCAGNGGMLLTDDKTIYEKAKVLRSWGRMSTLINDSENIKKRLDIKLQGYDYDKKFVFSEIGYNFEPSEIGAAFGLVQLKKFTNFSKIRVKNFNLHKIFFSKLDNFFIEPKVHKDIFTNFLAYPIILKKNNLFDRKKLQIYLENKGIQTRPIFSGNILRHPAFKNLISRRNKLNAFENADYIMKNGILIGCHQGLDNAQIKYIHTQVLDLIKKSS